MAMQNPPDQPPCPGPLDLTDETVRRDPYPVYRWYREFDPLHCLPPTAQGSPRRFLVTRWDDVRAGLKDARLRREVHRNALWNQAPEEVAPEFASYAEVLRAWPLFQDPPRHAKVRRPVNRVLDAAMSATARPMIAQVVADVLEGLPSQTEFDAVGDFARLVPLELDRRLFGLDQLDPGTLGQKLQTIGIALGNVFDHARIVSASQAIDFLRDHVEASIQRSRSGTTGAPMLARLLELTGPGGLIDEHQVVPLALLLLQAAQDSVIGTLANGLITLLRFPAQRDLCLARPDGFTKAVDEILRFESPVQQVTRHAAEDLEMRGVNISAGEGVSFLLGAANRDPQIFDDPDRFDIDRVLPGTAAFGFGAHACPGMDLGRSIAAQAWQGFFTRFPTLHYHEADLAWRPTVTFRTLARLPVRTSAYQAPPPEAAPG